MWSCQTSSAGTLPVDGGVKYGAEERHLGPACKRETVQVAILCLKPKVYRERVPKRQKTAGNDLL